MDLLPDFKDLLSELAASSADYLIVGGWAVGFHSEPRFTKDLDLLIGTAPDNLLRVVNAVRTFGAPAIIIEQLAGLQADEFLFLGAPPARVDLLRSIPGVDFASALSRATRVDWDGVADPFQHRERTSEAGRRARRAPRAGIEGPSRSFAVAELAGVRGASPGGGLTGRVRLVHSKRLATARSAASSEVDAVTRAESGVL